jgi:hypothetical protein
MNTIEMPKVGISGKVLQWEVINADGSVDQACYRPSDNMITDYGLNSIPYIEQTYSKYLNRYFCIGTGTAEPSATDTTLTAETYRAECLYTSYNSTTYSAAGSDPYYCYSQRGVQTALGVLNGTYGEIGFSFSATANASVFCKHRLKDELGNPTTITVSSAQQLRLKYVLIWCFSPSTVITGTVNISGIGDINYEAKWQKPTIGGAKTPRFMCVVAGQYQPMAHFPSAIGFVNIGNNYSAVNLASSTSALDYVSDSHEVFYTGYWSVDAGNTTIYGIGISDGNYSVFTVKFLQPFVKANTHAMSFTIKVSWGRS